MFLNLSLENEVKCQPCIGQRLRTNVTHFRTIVTDKNEAEHRVYHFNFDSSELRTKLLFFYRFVIGYHVALCISLLDTYTQNTKG